MAEKQIILFATVGRSAAVITETVWALAHESPSLIPHRVEVVTTQEGADTVRSQLLGERPGGRESVWMELRKELQFLGKEVQGRLLFGPGSIHVVNSTSQDRADDGTPVALADIVSPEDNLATGDFILERLLSFTERGDTMVIGSLAGGRKTMSALLYGAFWLVGRPWDRLTHVLVTSPFDGWLDPPFFFPPSTPFECRYRSGGELLTISTEEAKLNLADMPFVPLRDRWRAEFGSLPGSFSRLVASYREKEHEEGAELPFLELFGVNGRYFMEIEGNRVELPPRQFLYLWFLALRCRRGEIELGVMETADLFEEFLRQSLESNDSSLTNLILGARVQGNEIDGQYLSKTENAIDRELVNRPEVRSLFKRIRVYSKGAIRADIGRMSLD